MTEWVGRLAGAVIIIGGLALGSKVWNAGDTEVLASGELVNQLRADLANANDRNAFLEDHISQLTKVLNRAKPRSWWSRMWRGE
jgi:hypothetical protein